MKKKLLVAICIFIPLSVILYGCLLMVITWPVEKWSIANAGVFGDSFGILTSLFSALAFIGVLLTYFSQKEESRDQKKELLENRIELKKQRFENSFFQMLKIHNEIINSMAIDYGGSKKEGRVVLNDLKLRLHGLFENFEMTRLEPEPAIIRSFNVFYDEQGYQLAHYFRFLYNIFRFLSESDIEGKELYVRLVRAQISNRELYMIYYNALTLRGANFKKYIIEFELMDNLSKEELCFPEHTSLIPGAGFKD